MPLDRPTRQKRVSDSHLATKGATPNCPHRTLRPLHWLTAARRRTRRAVCAQIFAEVVRRLLSSVPSSAPDVAAIRDRQPTNPTRKPALAMRERSSLPIECTVNNIHLQIAPVVRRQRIVAFLAFDHCINDAPRRLLLSASLSPVT